MQCLRGRSARMRTCRSLCGNSSSVGWSSNALPRALPSNSIHTNCVCFYSIALSVFDTNVASHSRPILPSQLWPHSLERPSAVCISSSRVAFDRFVLSTSRLLSTGSSEALLRTLIRTCPNTIPDLRISVSPSSIYHNRASTCIVLCLVLSDISLSLTCYFAIPTIDDSLAPSSAAPRPIRRLARHSPPNNVTRHLKASPSRSPPLHELHETTASLFMTILTGRIYLSLSRTLGMLLNSY